ncbi:MAG: hypothetical protein KDK76_00005 [Chlamydiia bacterium]|nr:hypothetical protein [Chlamydiia bacterium]
MDIHQVGGAPPPPQRTWGQILWDASARTAQWVEGNFRAVMDYAFPPFVPPPVPEGPHFPDAEATLPEHLRPFKLDPNEVLGSLQEGIMGQATPHNLRLLIRAAEAQLDLSKEYPTKFYQIIRSLGEKNFLLSEMIRTTYCTLRRLNPEENQNILQSADLSVKGVYDALLWLQNHEEIEGVGEKTNPEVLNLLLTYIPTHFATRWEENRARSKVYFILSALPQVEGQPHLDRVLGQGIKEVNPKIEEGRATHYLKNEKCDLHIVREGVKRCPPLLQFIELLQGLPLPQNE